MSYVEGLVTSDTSTIKPEGAVIPGLIAPHMRIWTPLLNLTWLDVSHDGCPAFDDMIAAIAFVPDLNGCGPMSASSNAPAAHRKLSPALTPVMRSHRTVCVMNTIQAAGWMNDCPTGDEGHERQEWHLSVSGHNHDRRRER